MLGDLPVPADARLGEADEPVGAGERLPLVPREEPVDPVRRVGRRVGHLDLHRPARVEAALDEPDLLQHPDQDTRIRPVSRSSKGEFLSEDLAPAAQPRVDGTKVGDRGDV